MTRKLPVRDTAIESNRLLWAHRDQLFSILWAWLLVMLPVYALAHWLSAGGTTGLDVERLLELPFLASVAVGWHRLLLEAKPVAAPYLALDRSVLRYAACSLVVAAWWEGWTLLARVNPALVDHLSVAVGFMLATLLLAILVGRCSLIFPAVAVGARLSLAQSWRLTRGNTFRIFWGSLLTLLPTIILLSLLDQLIEPWAQGPFARIAWATLHSLILAVGLTSGVSFLSVAYRFFTHQRNEGTPTSTSLDGRP